MRLVAAFVAAAWLSGCHASASDEEIAADGKVVNFAPPLADATPAPIRVLDNAVIRDLARGKTEGVYLLDLRRVPPPMRPEVAAERAEAAVCAVERRAAACARRETMVAELKEAGLCWGPDAEVEADRRWMRRGPGCRH